MYGDIKTYFVEGVLRDYEAYKTMRKIHTQGTYDDVRHSVAFATSLYHFREHLGSKKDFFSVEPDYKLLADIVNVSKHHKLNPKNGPHLFTNSDNFREDAVITVYVDKYGEYNHVEKVITITLDDGTERDFHEIIINVFNMWIDELKTLNLIDSYPKQAFKKEGIPRRTKKSGVLNIRAIQGLRLPARAIRLQRYNYETRQIEPINLGPQYKEGMQMEIKWNDGEDKEVNVPLTEADFIKLLTLKSEEEKLKFGMELAESLGLVTIDK